MSALPVAGREAAAVLLDVIYIFQLEPEMRLEYVSDAVAGFTGYTAEEYLADPGLWLRVLDPRDRGLIRTVFDADLGVATHLTLRWVGRDGRVMWSQQNARKVQREDGSVVLYGALNHVSARQIAEARAGIDSRYQMLAEDASDVVFQTDLAGRIAWVSESILAVAGWSPTDLVGALAGDLVDEEDRPAMRQIEQRVNAGDSHAGTVLRIRTAAGGSRFVSATLRPARDEDDRITGAVVGWRDVDEVVRAQRAAESEREILRATLDAQLDPQVLMQAVREASGRIIDFRFVEANAAACRDLRLGRDDVVGHTMTRRTPYLAQLEIFQLFIQAVERHEPLVLNDYVYPVTEDTMSRFDIRAVPVPDGLSLTWRNVTQRYEQAAALAQSEARYRLLLEESSDIVTFHDAEGRVQWVSPAIQRILGWIPEERYATTLELIHPDDMPNVVAAQQRLMAGEQAASTRLRMRRVDGEYRWMESFARAVRDDAGDVVSLVVVTHDIQAQMDYERALARSESRYRLLAENATDLVYRTSLDGVAEWVSEGVERILGYAPEDLVGRNFSDLVAPEDRESVDRVTREVLTGGRNSARFRMPTADGGTRWVHASIHLVRDDHGRPVGFVGGCRDVQAEVEAEQALDRRARTDDLTGLLNRREALSQLVTWLSPGNHHREELAVAFCDLDDFKGINDSMGHAVGDRLLQVVAERIRGCVRAGDTVARVGGDEILLILRGMTSLDAGVAVAEKVREAVGAPVRINGQVVPASVSIGVTMAEKHDDVDTLVARADRAMYRAKQAGRDQVVRVD